MVQLSASPGPPQQAACPQEGRPPTVPPHQARLCLPLPCPHLPTPSVRPRCTPSHHGPSLLRELPAGTPAASQPKQVQPRAWECPVPRGTWAVMRMNGTQVDASAPGSHRSHEGSLVHSSLRLVKCGSTQPSQLHLTAQSPSLPLPSSWSPLYSVAVHLTGPDTPTPRGLCAFAHALSLSWKSSNSASPPPESTASFPNPQLHSHLAAEAISPTLGGARPASAELSDRSSLTLP